MAQTAEEYKENLIRRLNSDARLAEQEAAFIDRDVSYAETEAIRETLQEKALTAALRGQWLRAVLEVVEGVDLP